MSKVEDLVQDLVNEERYELGEFGSADALDKEIEILRKKLKALEVNRRKLGDKLNNIRMRYSPAQKAFDNYITEQSNNFT